MESNSGIWGRITLPYSTLPEGVKFTLLVFSCKQDVDIVAVRSSHSTRTVYNNIALEPGTTGTGLREINVRGQRSSMPGKSHKARDGPKMAVSCWCSSKNERCQVYTTKVTSTGALASGLATTIAVG